MNPYFSYMAQIRQIQAMVLRYPENRFLRERFYALGEKIYKDPALNEHFKLGLLEELFTPVY